MNIGDVSERCGVPAKTIRYYEDIGLVTPARSKCGYREFSQRDIYSLAFVGRARSVGFSIEACRTLLALYEKRSLAISDKRTIASDFVAQIDQKIAELDALAKILHTLLERGQFGQQVEYMLVDDLEPRRVAGREKQPIHASSQKRDKISLEN